MRNILQGCLLQWSHPRNIPFLGSKNLTFFWKRNCKNYKVAGLWGTAHRAGADSSAVLVRKTGFCPLPSQAWLVEALHRCCPNEMHLWPCRLKSVLLKDKQKTRLALHMLPGRIHTSDIFLLPFGNTPEMSVPTNLNFTYQLNLTNKTRNIYLQAFFHDTHQLKSMPRLWSYGRDSLITASLRGSDPIQLNKKIHNEFQKCKPKPWAVILTVIVTHINSGPRVTSYILISSLG